MKVLLLTDIPPCKNYTAGIVLDQLCSFLPQGSLACYVVMQFGLDPKIHADLSWMPIESAIKPRENWRVMPGRLGGSASLAMENYTEFIAIPKLVQQIVRFGRESGATTLWCVLQGQTMIRLALPVARALNIPLRTEIWDPPDWWLRDRGVNRITRRRVLKEFGRVLRASDSCATASWAMAEEYGHQYGIPTIPFLPSLSTALALPPASQPHNRNEYVIGMAGQLYASKEWDALIAALSSVRWRIGEKDVKILLLGRSATFQTNEAMRVEFLGWRPQSETIRILAETDLLYCPYWFDPRFETEARLSFPSKLTSYLASGRPVLFHGPKYAGPGRFLDENKAGVCCNALAGLDIIRSLQNLVLDQQLYSNVARNGRTAFDAYFTLEKLRNSFAQFLQVPEDTLLK